ncbi:MAG TPA: hypothetical protein VN179_05285, partial [Solirubrobacterales bacterium]|nr:hypothetical protein [Solirubrobacterales bacterium]
MLPGAQYRFRYSLFESFLQYERDVTVNLRHLQQLLWERGQDPELLQLEEEVRQELWIARGAVDTELEEGRGRAEVVRAMRASPQVPESVLEYASAAEFLAEDPRRGAPVGEGQLGGADFGFRWSLEHPFKRWITTRWRVSWLGEPSLFMWGNDEAVHSDEGQGTTEVYAVEFLDARPG